MTQTNKNYWDTYLMDSDQNMKLWKMRDQSNIRLTDKIVDDLCEALDENGELRSYLLDRCKYE